MKGGGDFSNHDGILKEGSIILMGNVPPSLSIPSFSILFFSAILPKLHHKSKAG